MKRPELLIPIAAGLVAGSAHRQIARTVGCAPSTVTRMAARLGRHSLLLQALALGQLTGIDEPISFDHFETFVFSQDDRLGIGTAVGQISWFVYTMDPAPHRRAGRRSARRAPPRRPLPDPIPGSFIRSTCRVIRLLGSSRRSKAGSLCRRAGRRSTDGIGPPRPWAGTRDTGSSTPIETNRRRVTPGSTVQDLGVRPIRYRNHKLRTTLG